MIPYTDGQARTIAKGQAEIAQAVSDRWAHIAGRFRAFVLRMLSTMPPGPHL